jgi:hypothetical protein
VGEALKSTLEGGASDFAVDDVDFREEPRAGALGLGRDELRDGIEGAAGGVRERPRA